MKPVQYYFSIKSVDFLLKNSVKEDPGHQVILVLKMVVESGPLDLRLPALPQVKTMTMAARVDKLFAENLNCDCAFITHYTITGANLTGPVFLGRKEKIVAALQNAIDHGDLERMAAIRRNKRTL